MPSATIDTCCLIDLLASGHAQEILRASGHTWYLPIAVQAELHFLRQPDPTGASTFISVPIDIAALTTAGVLTVCQPDTQAEFDLFTQYAALFRSDGEAMCLALAESRSWQIATDDRRAISVAQKGGLTVISSPQLVRTWADNDHPDHATLRKALGDIEFLAQFRPNVSMPECQWWLDQLGN
jgi:hypothetical protein